MFNYDDNIYVIIEDRVNYYQEQKQYFYNLFKRAMDEKKYVRIYDFCVSVEYISFEPCQCYQCKVEYEDIHIYGKIFINCDNQIVSYKYWSNINAWCILCKCDINNNCKNNGEYIKKLEEYEIPLLLFKGQIDELMIKDNDEKTEIEKKVGCIYHYFLSKGCTEIVSDLNKISQLNPNL